MGGCGGAIDYSPPAVSTYQQLVVLVDKKNYYPEDSNTHATHIATTSTIHESLVPIISWTVHTLYCSVNQKICFKIFTQILEPVSDDKAETLLGLVIETELFYSVQTK